MIVITQIQYDTIAALQAGHTTHLEIGRVLSTSKRKPLGTEGAGNRMRSLLALGLAERTNPGKHPNARARFIYTGKRYMVKPKSRKVQMENDKAYPALDVFNKRPAGASKGMRSNYVRLMRAA